MPPAPVFDIDLSRAGMSDKEFREALKGYLAGTLGAIRAQCRTIPGAGHAACYDYSDAMDTVLRVVHDRARQSFLATAPDIGYKMSVVAVGGYGRRELCPKSDVDLLFLYPYKLDRYVEAMTEWMTYPLWDLGLDVGYSVRNVKETIKMASCDDTIRTALLDRRFITGHEGNFDESVKELDKFLFYTGADRFIEKKISEMHARHEKYGLTTYVLEPNIKEGRGALRDIQTAVWAARIKYKCANLTELRNKGVATRQTIEALRYVEDYLLRVRTEMHFLPGKKTDMLTFDAQEQVAARFGYRDRGNDYGVERFMRAYYLNTVACAQLSDELLEEVGRFLPEPSRRPFFFQRRKQLGDEAIIYKGKISARDAGSFRKDPVRILEFFRSMQINKAKLSVEAKRQIQQALPAVTAEFREDPRAAKLFLEILGDTTHLRDTLMAMNATRFLGRYIPEWAGITCKVQRDVYHVYTVDVHSIRAASVLARAEFLEHRNPDEDAFLRIFKTVARPDVLTLATLCHDIGKGRGHRHSEVGAEMAERICRRLGLSQALIDDVVFLVREHLSMAHAAQRRDLHDLDLILSFSGTVGTMARLDQLYLLTYSDIRAVGPEVWNHWKSMLIGELYAKAKNVLEHGALKHPFEQQATRRREAVRDLLKSAPPDILDLFMSRFDDRYFLGTPDTLIPQHFRMLSAYSGAPMVEVIDVPETGASEVIVLCPDRRGLFATIAGTLSADSVNILNAAIATTFDGVAVDTFYVSGIFEEDPEQSRRGRLAGDLKRVLSGSIDVPALLAERRTPRFVREKLVKYRPTRVVFDNSVSTRYTVVDIFTYDRIGLLFDITGTLTALGVDIVLSKIATKADQVADVFYLADQDGGKITDPARQEEIRAALMDAIAGEQ
ncbi:MAG TPA: [protein-PII] uridylyltransferase [Candidatus Deferrimicrobiaceae bacterium]